MAGARLHVAADAENAAVAQAVGRLEVVVGLVEDEEGLVPDLGKALPEALVQRFGAGRECGAVGAIALGIGRVGGGEVGCHALGDHPRIGRQQPEMGIEAAGTVIVVMVVAMAVAVVIVCMIVRVGLAEMPQGQPRQLLQRHARTLAPLQRTREEILHIRADPVEQRGLLQAPYVGRPQRVVMRRGAGRQQHVGLADTVLHRGGNQLQGLDAGQHLDLGLGGRGTDQQRSQQREGKKTGHGQPSVGGNGT